MGIVIKRGIIIILGLALQISIYLFAYLFFINKLAIIHIAYGIISLLLTLYLIKNSKNYSYTLPWIVILLLFPIVGALLYIILGRNKRFSKTLKSIVKHEKESKKYLVQDKQIRKDFEKNSRIRYLCDYSGYPVTENNRIDYYPLGDDAFPVIIEELKKAEKFIFFEYFIVAHGKMWNSVLEILEEKAKKGVDVRVMYDDLGCLALLPKNYPQQLEKRV